MRYLKEISENLNETYVELKRIDHLIYVSLKYTRTVDVIVSVVERMINFFNLLIDSILEHHQELGNIDTIQKSPGLKCDQLRSVVDDSKIDEMIDFYLLLRKIVRMKAHTINEYKRHVGRVTQMDNGTELIINIDLVTEYYKRLKDFFDHVNNLLLDNKEE
jgi:hypothetical protein